MHDDRERLIAQISELNPTATRSWLEQFDAQALREYLDHLHFALRPRHDGTPWGRRGPRRAAA